MNHVMNLKESYSDDSERWKCDVCGREFIVSWNPYKKDVLNQGDPNATHTGSKLLALTISMGVNMLDDVWLDAFDELNF